MGSRARIVKEKTGIETGFVDLLTGTAYTAGGDRLATSAGGLGPGKVIITDQTGARSAINTMSTW